MGSGIGLTGLVASLECQPESFHFSDCHQSVLKTLCENIQLNCQNLYCDAGNNLEGRSVLKRQLQNGVQLSVLNLPWEEVDDGVCKELGRIDLILAADVVYDSGLFKPLIGALKNISKTCEVEDIVFACTERNPETLERFLQEIGKYYYFFILLSSCSMILFQAKISMLSRKSVLAKQILCGLPALP